MWVVGAGGIVSAVKVKDQWRVVGGEINGKEPAAGPRLLATRLVAKDDEQFPGLIGGGLQLKCRTIKFEFQCAGECLVQGGTPDVLKLDGGSWCGGNEARLRGSWDWAGTSVRRESYE